MKIHIERTRRKWLKLSLRGLVGLRGFWLLFLPLWGMGGFVSAQTLNDYLGIAAENNPNVRAAYTEFEAAMQKAPQVSSLPDPSLTMSAFGRMVETRLGAQEARFSLMQMFPWFGTLEAKEEASILMAEASFQQYLDLRKNLFFDIKSVYAELYALKKILQLKNENLEILNSYRELALSRFKSGNSPMVNVVKVDIQLLAAQTEIELLQEQVRPLQARFNLLLNREKSASIEVPDTLSLGTVIVPQNIENLFKEHPSVIGFEKQRESYELQEVVAEKEGMPMLGLGVDYSIISKRTDANPEMNGQDAIMPMLTVTLPIYRKKYRAARKEAELMARSTELQQSARINELQYEYESMVYELQKAERLIELYTRQVTSSDQANKLLISGFSSSITDFEEVLQMNQDILLYKAQAVEALKNGLIAEARLEYLLSEIQK
ncbi:TolC family protein [Antarcticibacterium sp. 1MA-6-2]|uniref:TolC family protein n=1 Tax=Antarcticibacterium sp. 1MA-6-2 TaxID=2908210 RepID=UPI001F3FEEEC|nr:TolC family protein [Antarcticibacterium sp. 1MA-6-2]UJH89819.1 TolC family protein [Antarcticibacterium sp. 1MA-6-2]